MRQAMRMRYLADGVVKAGRIAVADFVCPTEQARAEFAPDYTVWMDTIKAGRFEDTNRIFEPPAEFDYHVSDWFTDTHEQLARVVADYMKNH
jgi:adenylylsulfate kinase